MVILCIKKNVIIVGNLKKKISALNSDLNLALI